MKKIKLREYHEACIEYADWALADKTLYRLCKMNPTHTDMYSINGKLWLIGRTYATGIERQIESTGDPLSQIAEHFYKNRKKIDTVLGKLSAINEPLNQNKLEVIVKAHGQLVKLLSPILRKSKSGKHHSARSFVSKYMHFHHPIVPIYDNIAKKNLCHLIPWKDSYEILQMKTEVDEEYYYFTLRFLQLYNELKTQDKTVTVKSVDRYLLNS